MAVVPLSQSTLCAGHAITLTRNVPNLARCITLTRNVPITLTRIVPNLARCIDKSQHRSLFTHRQEYNRGSVARFRFDSNIQSLHIIMAVDPLSVFTSLLAKTLQEVLQKRLGGLERSACFTNSITTTDFTLIVESILSSHFENSRSDSFNV